MCADTWGYSGYGEAVVRLFLKPHFHVSAIYRVTVGVGEK